MSQEHIAASLQMAANSDVLGVLDPKITTRNLTVEVKAKDISIMNHGTGVLSLALYRNAYILDKFIPFSSFSLLIYLVAINLLVYD